MWLIWSVWFLLFFYAFHGTRDNILLPSWMSLIDLFFFSTSETVMLNGVWIQNCVIAMFRALYSIFCASFVSQTHKAENTNSSIVFLLHWWMYYVISVSMRNVVMTTKTTIHLFERIPSHHILSFFLFFVPQWTTNSLIVVVPISRCRGKSTSVSHLKYSRKQSLLYY